MLKQTIRKLVPDSLIDYLRSKLGVPSQEDSLLRLKKLGYMPGYWRLQRPMDGCFQKYISRLYYVDNRRAAGKRNTTCELKHNLKM